MAFLSSDLNGASAQPNPLLGMENASVEALPEGSSIDEVTVRIGVVGLELYLLRLTGTGVVRTSSGPFVSRGFDASIEVTSAEVLRRPIFQSNAETIYKLEGDLGEFGDYLFLNRANVAAPFSNFVGVLDIRDSIVAEVADGTFAQNRLSQFFGDADANTFVFDPDPAHSFVGAYQGFDGDDRVEASNWAVRIDGGDGDDTLNGGDESDVLNGDGGDDVIKGRAGADEINGGGGFDKLSGGEGDDSITGEGGADRIRGQKGDDVLSGLKGRDVLSGGAGADELSGWKGRDILRGGAGGDELDGGDGQDRLIAGRGDDVLIGGGGRDSLNGGAGDDSLFGGVGVDVLRGGPGEDRFNFRAGEGKDIVLDFQSGEDRLSIDVEDLRFSHLNIQQMGGATLVAAKGVQILLRSTEADDLSPSDFIFA